MKRVLLDTSFVLTALECGIDFFSEIKRVMDTSCEVCIVEDTLKELNGKKYESLAKSILASVRIIKSSHKGNVDSQLLEESISDAVVATQDKKLKEKLKKRKIPIITIRQKKHVILIQ